MLKKASIKKQMIYANKKKVKYVLIFGESEFASKKVLIKNMDSGSQKEFSIDKLLDCIE